MCIYYKNVYSDYILVHIQSVVLLACKIISVIYLVSEIVDIIIIIYLYYNIIMRNSITFIVV